MKKAKLHLADLKVKSFVTELPNAQHVKGGAAAIKTLPLNECISDMAYSACQTCQFQCTTIE
ncbi:MAG TPA: pinensin family lanthipeptide [Luteibaculaceae bacterium]|nr:pinensin family lanthipeptide [Luteibaculaceae bacterium]